MAVALDRFTITASNHADCFGCLAEAESAAIYAGVTGSRGATHSTTGDQIPDPHGATVARKSIQCPAPSAEKLTRLDGTTGFVCPTCGAELRDGYDGIFHMTPDDYAERQATT